MGLRFRVEGLGIRVCCPPDPPDVRRVFILSVFLFLTPLLYHTNTRNYKHKQDDHTPEAQIGFTSHGS